MKYSAFRILREGPTGNKGWGPVWRDPEPKSNYDIIIVGDCDHGLATAYYLDNKYEECNVAVFEKGLIDSGKVVRNTKNIRSNYLLSENKGFMNIR